MHLYLVLTRPSWVQVDISYCLNLLVCGDVLLNTQELFLEEEHQLCSSALIKSAE